ncbi:hypothetical protein [Pontibacter sp. H249]|uniref:hypothetical protein n=1 Tax=Pontibacter sp. H249 TaxID=3133420 RepID=UPI0030BF15A7
MSASRGSGDELQRGIATQEQRKRKQRDARGRGLAALSTPKPEMKQDTSKTEQ